MSHHVPAGARVSIGDLAKMKASGERWAMLTAYDYSIARLFDDLGIPVLLVGTTPRSRSRSTNSYPWSAVSFGRPGEPWLSPICPSGLSRVHRPRPSIRRPAS
jgi:hypothetical protein